jgi:Family of unknown function (DUF6526)
MDGKAQTFANHARFDPWFHFFVLPVLFANFFVCCMHEYHDPRHFDEWLILMSIVLLVLAVKVRGYALKVQDRIIRLEERLRLSTLLSASTLARLAELKEGQLVALRFASDAEIPGLVEKTLSEKLEPKQIKQAIQNWRSDFWRV